MHSLYARVCGGGGVGVTALMPLPARDARASREAMEHGRRRVLNFYSWYCKFELTGSGNVRTRACSLENWFNLSWAARKRRCGADDGTFFTLTHTHTHVCVFCSVVVSALAWQSTHTRVHTKEHGVHLRVPRCRDMLQLVSEMHFDGVYFE